VEGVCAFRHKGTHFTSTVRDIRMAVCDHWIAYSFDVWLVDVTGVCTRRTIIRKVIRLSLIINRIKFINGWEI
jgi:hypothetical protein